MRNILLSSMLTVIALSVCACDGAPEPTSGAAPTAAATSAAATSSPSPTAKPKVGPGEIAWDVPAKWKELPNPNAMRIATYLIPRADGDPDDGEMSVSRVGGGVEANIGRWKGQFDPMKPESSRRFERQIAGLKVTIYEVAGAYTGMVIKGQPTKAREGWALVAGIVEVPGGDPWFFKLTGPEKTVAAARPDFESLTNSVRPK
jgi:hypothetical protein